MLFTVVFALCGVYLLNVKLLFISLSEKMLAVGDWISFIGGILLIGVAIKILFSKATPKTFNVEVKRQGNKLIPVKQNPAFQGKNNLITQRY